jgi:hypothetical protein
MARPGEEGKLDASGTSHSGNANVAEICNQVLMMLSHEIFDPEFGKRVLIDQAFIVGGGEITKQALNWARQRTRRLAATVNQLHGPQRHWAFRAARRRSAPISVWRSDRASFSAGRPHCRGASAVTSGRYGKGCCRGGDLLIEDGRGGRRVRDLVAGTRRNCQC